MTKAEKIDEIIRILKKLSGEAEPGITPGTAHGEIKSYYSDCRASIPDNEHMKEVRQ